MMSCKVKFTATAKEDLRSVAYYIAHESGDKDVAERFVKDIQKKCELLVDFPEIGALPRDRVLVSLGYRFLVHGDYLIFYDYRKDAGTVNILAVFNSKRDYMRVMRKMIGW